MQTLLFAYFLAAILASVLLVVVGWRHKHYRSREPRPGAYELTSPLSAQGPCEIGAAAIVALNRLQLMLSEHGKRVNLGIRPGLLVRISGEALADILEDLLATMVRRGGHPNLLLTAAVRGGQIAITLSDSTPNGDESEMRGAFRSVAERVALRGGALDVAAHVNAGSSVTLRLAVAAPPGVVAPRPTDRALPEDDDFIRSHPRLEAAPVSFDRIR